MKKVKLIIEIDDELLDYIRNGHYDKHLQQRFDYQSKWAIKNGKPLQTELEEIKAEIDELYSDCLYGEQLVSKTETMKIIDKEISELKGVKQ